MATSCIFGNFFSSCFMAAIQAFWFVAEAAAETMRDLAAVMNLLGQQVHLAGPDLGGGVAWFTNRFRQVGASES